MLRVYREYERRKVRSGLGRLRGSDRAGDPALRRRRGRAEPGSRALSGVHGRRVPGREPAPADASRPLARRPRRALRGRRRLPVDLRVHGREPRAPAGDARPVPARDGDSPRGELPLDARGARVREPARAAARRRGEGAPGDAGGRAGARRALVRDRRRWRPRSSSSGSRRCSDEGVPHEEMAILFRTNARSADYEEALSEAGIPSQGAALLAARCGQAAPEGAPRPARSATSRRSRGSRACST